MAQKMEDNLANDNWSAWQERYGHGIMECDDETGRIEILTSRSGLPTVRVISPSGRPVLLHSSVDPVKEARRAVASISAEPGTLVVVYGLGLGYLVEELLAELDEKIPLFVLEPDRELLCAAMRTRDLRPIILSERVYISTGDLLRDLYFRFTVYYDAARFEKMISVGLPGHETVYSDFFKKAGSSIRDNVSSKYIDLVTMINIGPDMIISSMRNLVDYYTHPGIKSLFDKLAGMPVIIVAAGPSLNKNIHLLHEAKGKAVIMAVGTAAKALQKHGIEPDFVVSIDPGLPNYKHFQELNTENTCLITEMQSHHLIIENFKGPMFMGGQMPMLEWFKGVIETKGTTESGGSVANNTFSLAQKMGADPIIFIGQDLAYGPDGHTHASGTNYENNVISGKENRGYIMVKGNNGDEVKTDRFYRQFIRFYELWIRERPDREYINATEGGAYIEGTKVMTLREVLDKYCQKTIDVQTIIRQAQESFKMPKMEPLIKRLLRQKKKMENTISEAQKALKRLKQLEQACESGQGEKIQKHMTAVQKIYEKFASDKFAANLPEWFAKKDLHSLMSRTYKAERSDHDDFHAAIRDYKVYYEKICAGAERVKELLADCIQKAERRMLDG